VQQFSSPIWGGRQLAGASHRGPVISIGRSTNQAHLIVLAVNATVGPRELVGAESSEESLEELGRHYLSCSFTLQTRVAHHALQARSWKHIAVLSECGLKVPQQVSSSVAPRFIHGALRVSVRSHYPLALARDKGSLSRAAERICQHGPGGVVSVSRPVRNKLRATSSKLIAKRVREKIVVSAAPSCDAGSHL
jgi:hypothetical protein